MTRDHMAEIHKFFVEQERMGIPLTREKELKKWARENHMSPTTLHQKLEKLVHMDHLVQDKRVVNGRLAVSYGLSTRFRDWWIEGIRHREERGWKIHNLKGEEKTRALEELIGFTMYKFSQFVPFFILYVLENEERISDLYEPLDNFWNWCLSHYMFLTAQACLRDREVASKLEIIKFERKRFEEHIKSDAFKKLREEGIVPWVPEK